jgi:hypothetical protein
MLKYLGHKTSYWEKNKPKQIGDQKVTTDDWDNIIRILNRINKCVSLNKIASHYEKKKDRALYKNFLAFKNSKTQIQALKEHSSFMTYIYDQDKKRQDNIDNKARQIITNVSLVFTFIAFSSAIILNKDNYVKGVSEYSLLTVSVALIIALIAIILAVLCLDVKKYSRPRQEIVFDPKYRLEEDFLRQKVSDFFFTLYVNTDTNSKKSNYVKFANWLFIISIGLIGFFTILNLYAIKVRNDKPTEKTIQEIKIKDTIDVKIIKPKDQCCGQ